MQQVCCVLVLAFASSISLQGQIQPQPPPQTARQALIEMFLGKNADALQKHLPEVARKALVRKSDTPETSLVQKIAMIGRQVTAQGEHLETFEAGPTLLVSEQSGGREKVEVTVEHDSLMGEDDEIEVSIHVFRNGEPEFLPVIPRLTFSMKQEKEIWRLNEVTLAVHAPLTDPDYLKGLRKEQDESNENMASGRVGMIASAESTYAAKHPDHGYTCKLAELFAQKDSADDPDQTPEENDFGLASGEFAGYSFALSGCEGSPASKYQITATPTESDSGMKTFCADQLGTIRFTVGGKSSSCFTRGQTLSPARSGSYTTID
jgi:hypothetical protein